MKNKIKNDMIVHLIFLMRGIWRRCSTIILHKDAISQTTGKEEEFIPNRGDPLITKIWKIVKSNVKTLTKGRKVSVQKKL